jgi:hypothetical protein
MSLAFCLHEEPLPAECGCCPSLADSLTIKQETEPLRYGANRLQVQCYPGQFLVLGNCMIDVPSAAEVADLTMFRFGFPPTAEHPDGDHPTWGCSWYNPTGNTQCRCRSVRSISSARPPGGSGGSSSSLGIPRLASTYLILVVNAQSGSDVCRPTE